MKKIIVLFYFFIVAISSFSQENEVKTIVLEINNVMPNRGAIHISAFLSETAYKRQTPDYTFQVNSTDSIIRTELILSLGECVISVYQDVNGNGICDTGLFSIPKEPVGITNWNGKGPPGNFNKHKININNITQILSISLHQL